MRKEFATIVMILSACIGMSGAQITETEALQRASQLRQNSPYLIKSNKEGTQKIKLAYKAVSDAQVTKGENLLYVFNYGDNNGYAIIAADDKANEILGYSDRGSFDYSKMPDNMKYWISEYGRQIEYIKSNPDIQYVERSATETEKSVLPLLDDINWYQNSPYNDQCPIGTYVDSEGNEGTRHCYTGCVATAMAQVMRYHKYPAKGIGSHSYQWKGQTLTVDYANATYDWTKMLPTYNNVSSTDEEKAEVAKLMYHVGVSVDMVYGTNDSGAVDCYIVRGLVNNFGYDNGARWIDRSHLKGTQWEDTIKAELDAKRPVIYCGQDFTGNSGHCFVCDGYNGDYFHINWGWNGDSNGYFKSTALKPVRQGIGGSVTGDFSFGQDITIGIQPKIEGSKEICALKETSIKTISKEVSRSENIEIKLIGVSNVGYNTITGNVGMWVVNKDKKIISSISSDYNFENLQPVDAVLNNAQDWNIKLTIPATIPNGTYGLLPWAKLKGDNEEAKINMDRWGFSNNTGIMIIVSDDKITLSDVVENKELTILSNDISNLECRSEATVAVTFENPARGLFQYPVCPVLVKAGSDVIRGYMTDTQTISMESKGSQKVVFKGKFLDEKDSIIAAGDYNLKFLVYVTTHTRALMGNIPVTLAGDVVEEELILTAPISTKIPGIITADESEVKMMIKNIGRGVYAKISCDINPIAEASGSECIPYNDAFAKNEEKECTIEVGFTCEDGQKYKLTVYDETLGASRKIEPLEYNDFIFTYWDKDPSGVEDINSAVATTIVYPNPATSSVEIKNNDGVKHVSIYSASGSLLTDKAYSDDETVVDIDISSLPASIYMVKVDTTNGSQVKRLIKK